MRKFLFTLLATSPVFFSFAQSPVLQRKLDWKSPVETALSETEKVRSLYFSGAAYDENNVPFFKENVPMDGNVQAATLQVENAVYNRLDDAGLLTEKAWKELQTEPKVEIGLRKKKSYACVSIPAVRKSATGQAEKLVSFD